MFREHSFVSLGVVNKLIGSNIKPVDQNISIWIMPLEVSVNKTTDLRWDMARI